MAINNVDLLMKIERFNVLGLRSLYGCAVVTSDGKASVVGLAWVWHPATSAPVWGQHVDF